MNSKTREIPKIKKIVKASICQAYCIGCCHPTPHLVVRTPGKLDTFICGVCNLEKVYSFDGE